MTIGAPWAINALNSVSTLIWWVGDVPESVERIV
jgi:hypothetical protein